MSNTLLCPNCFFETMGTQRIANMKNNVIYNRLMINNISQFGNRVLAVICGVTVALFNAFDIECVRRKIVELMDDLSFATEFP